MRKVAGMVSLSADIENLRQQLQQGSIQKAYRALLAYMMGLRTHFVNKYGNPAVSGLYQGYMDMTYFALYPPALKRRGLKVAIVFNYDAFRFEAWLAGRNRKIQRQYWELFRDNYSGEYRVVTPAEGVDAIVECDLVMEFDLDDPEALSSKIETGTVAFIDRMERFLSEGQQL
jgi:hypothetical protein